MSPTRAALERMLASARATVAEIEAAIVLVGQEPLEAPAIPADIRPAGPDWLTPQQAAALVGVHESTMTFWLRTGQVPGVKRKGRWMVWRDDLSPLMKRPAA